jgi:hypothetical protein
MDRRVGQDIRPVIVARKLLDDNSTSEVWWFSFNAAGVVTDRVISGSDVTPTGNPSIVLGDNDDFCYLHVTESTANGETNSVLYKIPLDSGGIPIVPAEGMWTPLDASIGMANADIAVGGSNIGLLGTDPTTGNLIFKLWDGASIGDSEDVHTGSEQLNDNGFGLTYKSGVWHSVFGFNGSRIVRYKVRDEEGTPTWVTGSGTISIAEGDYAFFGITNKENNPGPRQPYEFGVTVVDETGGDPYTVKYIHFADWFPGVQATGDNYWDKGELYISKHFGFDIVEGNPTQLPGNANKKIMDIINVLDFDLFTDQAKFMVFNNTYKEWVIGETYDNKNFYIQLPFTDGGNRFWKMIEKTILDYVIESDNEVRLWIFNEKNDSTDMITLDKDNVLVPAWTMLPGRRFTAIIEESSQDYFALQFAEMRGKYTGAMA